MASDTKARKRNGSSGGKRSPDEVSFESKVRVSGKHTVAVAISGRPLLNTDPAQEFVDYIATVSRIPESLVDVTEEWTKEYQDRHTGWDWWGFKLLIVNPNSKYEPIVTVEVAKRLDDCANQSKIKALPFSGFRISGNETNSAIMWPEYCRCGIQPLPDLETGTNIAALTILMGAELNSEAVGGLDIWRYTDEWRRASRTEIDGIADRFMRLKEHIFAFVHAAPS